MTFGPGDEGALPVTVTVTMGIEEAAAIARVFGSMNGHAITKLGVSSSIWSCLAGDVFNRYWEDGVNDVLPGAIMLGSLNDPPVGGRAS